MLRKFFPREEDARIKVIGYGNQATFNKKPVNSSTGDTEFMPQTAQNTGMALDPLRIPSNAVHDNAYRPSSGADQAAIASILSNPRPLNEFGSSPQAPSSWMNGIGVHNTMYLADTPEKQQALIAALQRLIGGR